MSPRKQRRQPGSSGGAYANRSDLSQPVAVPTGLPYGERQQLEQAQQGAPLPQTGPPPQGMDPAVLAAMQHDFQPVGLAAPSDRPYEPVTHGLASGPGGGPEVLPQPGPTTTDTLRKLAMSTGDPDIQNMVNRLQQYGV